MALYTNEDFAVVSRIYMVADIPERKEVKWARSREQELTEHMKCTSFLVHYISPGAFDMLIG
jgi:hypothetical protein